MAEIEEIKKYWEENTPQYWYTGIERDSREYYEEIQKVRYTAAYPYLKDVAEFDRHAGEKVLEIGCGQGTDLLQFAKGGAEVTGVDLTEGAIEKTAGMFKACGQEATLMTANAEALTQFADNTFDVVYSFGVLHHTPDTKQAFAEVRRVLKPGGKAIIMLYAKGFTWMLVFLYWYIFKLEFLKSNFKNALSIHAEHGLGCPLANYYSKPEARAIFKEFSDVDVVQLHCYNFEPDAKKVSFLFKIKHAVCDILNKSKFTQNIFGHNIIIKAIK